MADKEKLASEKKINLELEAEIHVWKYGNAEDLGLYKLTDKTRQNKLNYLSTLKRESDSRLKELQSS